MDSAFEAYLFGKIKGIHSEGRPDLHERIAGLLLRVKLTKWVMALSTPRRHSILLLDDSVLILYL